MAAQDPLDDPTLLARMSPSLVALARKGTQKAYRANTLLIHEGDRSDTIFIVLTGRIEAFSASTDGQEFSFNTYGPGEFVGEMSLDGGPRSASVRIKEPSICVMITREVLEAHLEADPPFAFELLAKVIRRARMASLTARVLALNDTYGRLKLLLEDRAELREDGRRVVPERFTQQELANRCGCTREMVTRLMRDLRPHYLRIDDEGLIELLVYPLPAKF